MFGGHTESRFWSLIQGEACLTGLEFFFNLALTLSNGRILTLMDFKINSIYIISYIIVDGFLLNYEIVLF